MSENGGKKWIDFEALKKTANVEAVLSALGLLDDMVSVGREWKGQCPFHKGEGNIKPFCFNEEKRAFHCFACKRKGNVLDFVKEYLEWKNKEKFGVRQAAEYIDAAMAGYTPKEREEEKAEPRRMTGEAAAPLAVLEKEDAHKQKTGEVPKRKKNAETGEAEKKNPTHHGLNPEHFLDFIDACKLVSFNQATAQDFVAVRVSFLQQLRAMFFEDEAGEK